MLSLNQFKSSQGVMPQLLVKNRILIVFSFNLLSQLGRLLLTGCNKGQHHLNMARICFDFASILACMVQLSQLLLRWWNVFCPLLKGIKKTPVNVCCCKYIQYCGLDYSEATGSWLGSDQMLLQVCLQFIYININNESLISYFLDRTVTLTLTKCAGMCFVCP